MLIRTNGGESGIKDYLEDGQKRDRYNSRDELDERVILAGNLDFADNTINAMSNAGEKYFHVTLSFKEDHVPNETLKQIADEFRLFYFHAYDDAEIQYYAEAHLPKIKSYKSANGELIERKPHIHITMPKINVITQQGIDYKELDNIPYLDAFQEYINAKHGLESPKDNLRYKVNENSEYIDRYKGDGFKGKGKDFRVELLNTVLSKNINSLQQLAEHLENSGHHIQFRNKYKRPDMYINIKMETGNINLNDWVFKDEFLTLPNKDKFEYLNKSKAQDKSQNQYIIPGAERPIDKNRMDTLNEWYQLKSLELRHTRNFSNNQLAAYQELSYEDKIKYLTECQAKVRAKHQNKDDAKYENHIKNNLKDAVNEYRRIIVNNLESASSNLRSADEAFNRVCGIETGAISNQQRRRISRRHTDNIGQSTGGQGRHRNNPAKSSVVGGIEYNKTKDIAEFLNKNTKMLDLFKQFNKQLKADVLLELLEKTHGVNPEIYQITVASDGSDRIGVGNRNLNNLDFCIKEMHFNLQEAIPLLRNALAMQEELYRERGSSRNTEVYLRTEFNKWLKNYKNERAECLANNKLDAQKFKDEIKNKYKAKVKAIREDKAIFYHRKQEKIRAAKFEQMAEFNAASKALAENTRKIRNNYNLEMQQAYRTFLMRKAQDEDDEKALRELRRLRINFIQTVETVSFQYSARYDEFKLNLKHEIDKDGVINYKIDDTTIIRDHGSRVEVAKTKDQYIELSFKLARQKMGDKLSLRGKESFRKKCVEIAVRNGYQVEFLDDFSKEYHQELLGKLKAQSEVFTKHGDLIIADNPQKLVVADVKVIDTLLYHRQQSVRAVTLIAPENNKSYCLSGSQINFFADKLELGEFVTCYKDKATNEIKIKYANEQALRNKVKTEIIQNNNTAFINSIKTKHSVDNFKAEYRGTLIKVGQNKTTAWVLIKDQAGKFIKLENDELYQQLKNVKAGNQVSIIIPKSINKSEPKAKKDTSITLVKESLTSYIEQYKKTPKTILGDMVKQTEFKFVDGKLGYRYAVKNIVTGQAEVFFMNKQLPIKVGDFCQVDKLGFNKYSVNIANEVGEKIKIKFANNGRDDINGQIKSIGSERLRGKDVFCLELQTIDGIVKKYGDSIKQTIIEDNLKIGDYVQIKSTESIILVNREINIVESTNLTETINEQANKQLIEIQQSVQKKR